MPAAPRVKSKILKIVYKLLGRSLKDENTVQNQKRRSVYATATSGESHAKEIIKRH